jgi:hypothetical protein
MVDQQLGGCDHSASTLLTRCDSVKQFEGKLNGLLCDWQVDDQFIFYFSGYGDDLNDVYCLKFGTGASDWLPFANIYNLMQSHGVRKAIIILDACYSGKAIKSDKLNSIGQSLPSGYAYLVSSGERQKSREKQDGSVSVFTELLRDALDSGLGGKATSDDMICVDDIAGFVRDKLQNDVNYREYAQRPLFDVRKADERVWVSQNRSRAPSSKEVSDKINESCSFGGGASHTIRSYVK